MVYCASPATLRLETVNPAGTVTSTLDLMDDTNGYRVASLDVAFPTVRDLVAALPSRDGDYDTTRLYGPRTVTVTGNLIASPAGSRQTAMQTLAWWCQPRLRPRMVYAYDAGSPLLWLGLRGSQLAAPASNPTVSAFTVSWVAPSPAAQTLTTSTVTVNPAAAGTATNNGTYRAWPLLDLYGPCTNPQVVWTSPAGGVVAFTGLTIAAGHYVRVDTNTQTCLLDNLPASSVYANLDFTATRWYGFEPGATQVQFTPATSSSPSRLIATWADTSI